MQDKRIKLDKDAAVSTKKQSYLAFASKRKQEPPLQMPFELPINFPENIKVGLAEKQLAGRKRSKFVTKIAEAMYFQKSYPTADEYRHVAGLIIRKWPFLGETAGQVVCLVACTYSCMNMYVTVYIQLAISFIPPIVITSPGTCPARQDILSV